MQNHSLNHCNRFRLTTFFSLDNKTKPFNLCGHTVDPKEDIINFNFKFYFRQAKQYLYELFALFYKQYTHLKKN